MCPLVLLVLSLIKSILGFLLVYSIFFIRAGTLRAPQRIFHCGSCRSLSMSSGICLSFLRASLRLWNPFFVHSECWRAWLWRAYRWSSLVKRILIMRHSSRYRKARFSGMGVFLCSVIALCSSFLRRSHWFAFSIMITRHNGCFIFEISYSNPGISGCAVEDVATAQTDQVRSVCGEIGHSSPCSVILSACMNWECDQVSEINPIQFSSLW